MRASRSTSAGVGLGLLFAVVGGGGGGKAWAEPARLRVVVAEGTGPMPGDLALDLSLQNTTGRPETLPIATCSARGWTSFVTLQIKVPGGRTYRFYASGRADLADEHEHTKLVLAPGQTLRQRVPFLEAVRQHPVGDTDAGLARGLGGLTSVEISATIAGGPAAPAVSYRFALPQVPGGRGCAQSVSAGPGPVCSLLADGTPYCWGPDAPGLGEGASDSESATPQPVGLLRRSVLDAGFSKSGLCALGARGEVFCTHAEAAGTPVRVAGLFDAVRLHLGRSEQCAARRDGSIACWGGATEGQASSSGMRPGAAAVPGLERDTAELVFGLRHTCARKQDGSLLCWGDNSSGQLGTGDVLSRRHPSPVRLAGPVDSVALGQTHSCAVLRDGSVQCWGKSEYGALGRGPESQGLKTNQSLLPVRVEGLGPAARVFAGYDKTAVKARDGGLYYFGGGALLDPSFGRSSTFRPLRLVALGTDVVEVVFGGRHACARKQDGAVFCWGEERSLGAHPNRPPAPAQPVRVPGLPADVTALTAGDAFTCALTGRGAVYCWGEGGAGQLGQGEKASSLSPVRVALPCN